MPQPTIIQGPAYIKRGTHVVYTRGDVVVRYGRDTWNPEGAITGKLGERLRSTRILVSAQPQGEVEALSSYWPFVPADIGKSIFGAATALEVVPLTGNKVTFPRSTVSRMPALNLKPTDTAWDPMDWTCLGNPTLEPNNAAYFQTLAAIGAGEGASNTDFDQTKVTSPRYTGAYGLTPFDTLEPEDGFRLEPIMEVKEMFAVNYGLVDIILASLGTIARFVPLNITEVQYATLLKLQDATALRPGDSLSVPTDDRDLVITGTGLTATLKHMGAGDGGMRYGTGVFRQGEVVMHNRRTYTAGVPDALWTLA